MKRILAVVTILGIAASAEAATYSATGVACETAYNEGSTYLTEWGVVYNTATNWARTIVCPLTTNGNVPYNIEIGVIDKNPNQDFTCQVMFQTDAFSAFTGVLYSSGASASRQILRWGPMTGWPNARWSIYCYVPMSSAGSLSGVEFYRWSSN